MTALYWQNGELYVQYTYSSHKYPTVQYISSVFLNTANRSSGVGFIMASSHWRRIRTEEKANFIASVWGEEFIIYFLAALAVLPRTILNTRWIAPGWFKWKGWIYPILQNCPIGKIASATRNWINSSLQTEATTFAFSSVVILHLCFWFSMEKVGAINDDN